ncbi:MAG: MarR family transcriptional regulator [Clostridia bacterium]|nr:MarR family transcriptional regulator [Clostridia bacterium]
MEQRFRIGSEIKAISNLIKREIGNYDSGKYIEEATGNNMFIIGHLARHRDEDVFQKDLEELFSVRRSTMSGIILRMEQKGFLVRESVEYDARLKKLVLTEKGWQIHEMMESIVTDTEKKLTADFSEEQKDMLFLLLKKLRQNLETDV